MGLSVRMVKAAIDFCKERGIPELVLETTSTQVAARKLYKKMGFSTVFTHTKFYSPFWVVKLANIKFIRMKLCL